MLTEAGRGRLRVATFSAVFAVVLVAGAPAGQARAHRARRRPEAEAPALPGQVTGFAAFPGASSADPSRAERLRVSSAYARLPLAFEPNRGQLGGASMYAARGPNYAVSLTRRGADLSLAHRARRTAGLSIGFDGARRAVRVTARSRLPGHVNYAIGRNRSRSLSGIPTFARIRYRRLWPGIDAAVYGRQRRLDYDFSLAPGADPSRIGLSFAGARGLRIDHRGALRIRSRGGGDLRQPRPRAYQRIGGRTRVVAARYVVRGNRVGLRIGRYDRSRRLVIDPALVYSTYVGGTGDDIGRAIAVEPGGAALVGGLTLSTDFPTTPGPQQGTNAGSEDATVSKLNAAGTALVYSTYLGGSSIDEIHAIGFDSTGSAYVGGRSDSTNFPVTAGAAQTTRTGLADGMIAKLDATGSLVYATYLGGNSNTTIDAMAVDPTGAVYVTGFTQSTTFPTTPNSFQPTFGGTADAFLTKLNPAGSKFLYSTYLGGSGNDQGTGIAIDSSGTAYVTGPTASTNLPTTAGALQTANAGGNDAFAIKLTPAAFTLPFYSTYLGGSGDDSGNGIALDSAGAAYIAGSTASPNFPTTAGALQTSNRGGASDAFVTKLNTSGSAPAYSTYLGGSGFDAGTGIVVDSTGAAHVAGATNSTDFPTTSGAVQAANAGMGDAFVTKLDPSGGTAGYSTYLGGSGSDGPQGIALDPSGHAYVIGLTGSLNFPTTAGAFQPAAPGNGDEFVTELTMPPVVTTEAASEVAQTSATLNGVANPKGDPTTSTFEYGTTTAYGSQVSAGAVGSDGSDHAVSAPVLGLDPGTTYHFRIDATNSAGPAFGGDQTLTTSPLPKHTLTVTDSGTGTGSVSSSPGGIDCGATCSAQFDEGTSVALTATAAKGSTFDGWSGGGCSGTGSCQVTLGSDAAVTATFTLEPPTLPNTKIRKAKINQKANSAKFTFKAIGVLKAKAAVRFQCALAKKHKKLKFRKCSSPKKYKHLKPGNYTFEVRAFDAAGKDPSPAKKKFRIK